MRQNKFQPNDVVNNLLIIKKDKVIESPNGSKKTYWICQCLKCGKMSSKSTQTIQHCKSCGCEQRMRTEKVKGSGRKTKEGTSLYINCLISTYKSNAKKRGIDFNLSYDDFERLVTSKCYYCGDDKANKLIKKNYPPFYYNGIDRVDNNVGYEKDNCVACCDFCNKAKRNISIEEFYDKCLKIANIAKQRIEECEKELKTNITNE